MSLNSGAMDAAVRYQPVIGGVAHSTWLRHKPAVGVMVRLMCGGTHEVSERYRGPVSECADCDAAFRRRFGLPPRQIPAGAGAPDHPAPAGLHGRPS